MDEVMEYLEWEKIDVPIIIKNVIETEPLHEGEKEIEILSRIETDRPFRYGFQEKSSNVKETNVINSNNQFIDN
jgi:hypothetical protein